MNGRVLVAVEADETHFALLFRLSKSFEDAIGRVDELGIVAVDHFVNLPNIEVVGLEAYKRLLEHSHGNILFAAMRADAAYKDDTVSLSFESYPKPFLAEPIEIFPGIVEDVDAMVHGFGDHIIDFRLVPGRGEMEAAHAQDRTLQPGLAKRTFWSLEVAEGRFVIGLDCGGNLVIWNHGGNSCERSTLQELSAAHIRSGFQKVSHNCLALNLRPRVAGIVRFLDHVFNLDLRSVEWVVVGQPRFGIIELHRSFV